MNKKESWEDRYYNRFPKGLFTPIKNGDYHIRDNTVKAFISTLVKETEEKAIKDFGNYTLITRCMVYRTKNSVPLTLTTVSLII